MRRRGPFCANFSSHAMRKIVGTRAVIVIGAGMAGLAAARRLQEAGVPVLVLEARSRLADGSGPAGTWGCP
jgi:cation diffusion facilitator CzcD-associated flavoprotein CzcO